MGLRTRLLFAVAAGVVLALAACATVVKPAELFSASSEDFARRLRWLDYQGAAQHMVEAVREDFLERFSGNDDLRVVDFTMERIEFHDDGRQLIAFHILEYYQLPSATLRKEQVRFEWEFREESKIMPGTWLITSEFPQLP